MIAPSIVVDSSVFLSFLMPDEHNESVVRVFNLTKSRTLQILVPEHFCIEVYNTLRYALTSRVPRITPEQYNTYAAPFWEHGILTDGYDTNTNVLAALNPMTGMKIRIDALRNSADLGIKHNLSVYDAAYLELALRRGCKLLTLDKALASAAKNCNVLFI